MAGQQNQPQPGQPQQGGAQSEPEGDALDELDAALGAEGEGGQEQPEEWTPPTREQWEAAQAAHQAALEAEKAKLNRARQQAKRLREGRGSQPGAAPAEGEGDGAPAPGPDPELAVWQQRAVRSAAKAELLNRGADPDMVDLALARLHVGEVDFTDDGDPELDTWLDEMEERYPKLFAKPTDPAPAEGTRRPMGGVDQGRASAGGPPKKMRFGDAVIANARRAQGRGR